MTDTETKALIERLRQRSNSNYMLMSDPPKPAPDRDCHAAADMLEQLLPIAQEFNDFRQEVSDIAEAHFKHAFTVQEKHLSGYKVTVGFEKQKDATAWFDQLLSLPKFITPKPKPDPLREIAEAWGLHNTVAKSWVEDLRATLEARGFEIREKNDD